jgi:hypothetical protein
LGEDRKVEMPDFKVVDQQAEFLIREPFGKSEARLVNTNTVPVRYTIKAVSDPQDVYIWPDDTPKTIGSGKTDHIRVVAPFATKAEYHFTLQTDSPRGTFEIPVNLRIPDFPAFAELRQQRMDAIAKKILEERAQPRNPGFYDPNNEKESTLRAVDDELRAKNPNLSEAQRLVLSADVLATLGMPEQARESLERAEKVSPSSVSGERVGLVGARIAQELGIERILKTRELPPLTPQQKERWDQQYRELSSRPSSSLERLRAPASELNLRTPALQSDRENPIQPKHSTIDGLSTTTKQNSSLPPALTNRPPSFGKP